jgi:DNA-binding PadR family transcriptional regulator
MAEQASLTTLEYALLGLIGDHPMSGYDLHRLFATTPLAHFSSSPGAIYPALRRLAQRGLLSAELDRTREARPRRVYVLTAEGEAALQTLARQQVTREEVVRFPELRLLRFAFAEKRLTPAEVVTYLEGWRTVIAAYLEELRPYLTPPGGMPRHGRLSLEYGLTGFESELTWIARALSEFAATAPRKTRAAKARPKR